MSTQAAAQLDLALPCPRRRRTGKSPKGEVHAIVGLFAGIGGFERGLHRAAHKTILLCENEPAAMAVLKAKFPDIPLHNDIRTLARLPRETTLVVAGFPCQDLSQAGLTRGIIGTRSGLVSEVFRLIEENKTPWVLLENVPFMLQLARGEAMHVITATLETLGYRWAYRVIDARAFGRPQRRKRVYLLASLAGDPRTVLFADDASATAANDTTARRVACGFYWTEGLRGLGWAVDAVPTLKGGSAVGIPSPPAILMPDGRVVTPNIRDAERLQGFPENWTKQAEQVTKRSARWKLVGNAVSVPVAAWIGRRLARPGPPRSFDVKPLQDYRQWPIAAWNVGSGRMRVAASEWPVNHRYHSLDDFLRHPTLPLSQRATRGFLQRAAEAKLKFPPGFLDTLRFHLAKAPNA